MNRNFQVCLKCGGRFRSLTRHHLFPCRNFGRKRNKNTIELCRKDHDKLELFIPFEEQPKWVYLAIVKVFLQGLLDEVRNERISA